MNEKYVAATQPTKDDSRNDTEMRSCRSGICWRATASLTAGIRTIESAADTKAGNNNSGTSTPEITPYKIVAAEAVNPAIVKAFKK